MTPSAEHDTMLDRIFTGSVVEPGSRTSHGTSQLIDMSMSVVISLIDAPAASMNTFCITGDDVLPATMFWTLLNPSRNFDLTIENFILPPLSLLQCKSAFHQHQPQSIS